MYKTFVRKHYLRVHLNFGRLCELPQDCKAPHLALFILKIRILLEIKLGSYYGINKIGLSC